MQGVAARVRVRAGSACGGLCLLFFYVVVAYTERLTELDLIRDYYLIALPLILLCGCASDEPVPPNDAGPVVTPTRYDDVANSGDFNTWTEVTHFGEDTTDEMCLALVFSTAAD